MPRIKGGPVHARKRKRLLKDVSGMRGASGHLYRPAIEFARKAGVYAYVHRKQKKRTYRGIWITRLNAALRLLGVSYNRFIPAAVEAGVELNRKMLSEIAIADPKAFAAVVDRVKPFIKQPKAAAKA